MPRLQNGAFPSESRLRWSQYVQVEHALAGEVYCGPIEESSTTVKIQNATFDLTSPREWLEYKEMKGGGRQGAYTVLRCDYSPQTETWKIWGKEFHLQRLMDSVRSLQTLLNKDTCIGEEAFNEATNASDKVAKLLLKEAESLQSKDEPKSQCDIFFTVMLTLLWQPEGTGIRVFGHTFSTTTLSTALEYDPEPVVASIALSPDNQKTLPNRFANLPEAKLSSWCRRRGPLEQQFKGTGTGEVLLTQICGEDTCLLEGLTSNLFVVYRGGVLRTPATDSVLGGYARHLVLEHAHRCGLQIEIGPISLKDSSLWEEIFLTSSIRLIAPVQKLVLPTFTNDGCTADQEVWSMEPGRDQLVWREVYRELFASS
jgi:hypothetical protein